MDDPETEESENNGKTGQGKSTALGYSVKTSPANSKAGATQTSSIAVQTANTVVTGTAQIGKPGSVIPGQAPSAQISKPIGLPGATPTGAAKPVVPVASTSAAAAGIVGAGPAVKPGVPGVPGTANVAAAGKPVVPGAGAVVAGAAKPGTPIQAAPGVVKPGAPITGVQVPPASPEPIPPNSAIVTFAAIASPLLSHLPQALNLM